MPDYAPHYTARYRLTYSVQGAEHTAQFRWARNAPIVIADMVAKVKSVLDAITTLRYTDWAVVRADFALQDSLIFLPTTAPAVNTGTAAITARSSAEKAYAAQFLGRSQSGGRGGFWVYGINFSVEINTSQAQDFRVLSTEAPATIGAAVTALGTGNPTLAANDGNGLIWYSYVNTKFNDYWLHRVRG